MGKLLCEKNLRDVWCRNESVRAEIGQILHTHAAKLVVEMKSRYLSESLVLDLQAFVHLTSTSSGFLRQLPR